MNTSSPDRLYQLLPAIYRQRDQLQGEPLRALLAIAERELQALEGDIAGLYNNWFIETCDAWVVPYIGDLLGVQTSNGELGQLMSQRAHVANTIRYRRRKGTFAVLERVAQDVTGWRVRAVEYFPLLTATQHLHHVRPAQGRTADIRDRAALAHLGDSFDTTASRVDVRRIASGQGKTNIANVGLFVSRIESMPITRGTARQVQPGHYTVHPLGYDTPLFRRPQPKTDLTQRTEAAHVPAPLPHHELAEELEALRQALVNGQPTAGVYFGAEPVLEIFINGSPLPPANILIQDLTTWQAAPPHRSYRRSRDGQEIQWPIQVALDPTLGRLTLPTNSPPADIRVSYAYGFSADIGGGPYDRQRSLTQALPGSWQAVVGQHLPAGTPQSFGDLNTALAAWSEQPQHGVIRILDNGIYDLTDAIIAPRAGQQLAIEAIDGTRPSIMGNLNVQGSGEGAGLTLNGLLLDGGIHVTQRGHFTLNITHCTLLPKGLEMGDATEDAQHITVIIANSIIGPLRLPADRATLTVYDSILHAASSDPSQPTPAIASNDETLPYGPPTHLERVTVFGPVNVQTLTMASETLFTDPAQVAQRQTGSVRYSAVPPGSQTPQRFRCQPDLALNAAVAENPGQPLEPAEAKVIESQTRPSFTTIIYGQPGYAQLSQQCPREIRIGAENRSEMGAFQHLLQPQREASLASSLAEYLPAGLEADIFYVN